MKILVSGASGLVGKKLVPTLVAEGHEVVTLVRKKSEVGAGQAFWDPTTGVIDADALKGAEAAINLAGESIAAGRWNEERKHAIRESRVQSTSTLANALAFVTPRPRVLINASAIGYYGPQDDQWLDESSSSGGRGDFLSGVCRDWEAATLNAAEAGIRIACMRFGVILSRDGGALAKMLTPFKLGLGGRIGAGHQYMSWIAIDDVVGAIVHVLHDDRISGPVNTVAPQPVTNAEFTATLGANLHRPTIFPMPEFAAKLVFGQMGEELLLSGQRVRPARLLESGYEFRYPDLSSALRHVLA